MAKVAMNGERENKVPMADAGMGAPQESTPQDIGICDRYVRVVLLKARQGSICSPKPVA